MKKRSIGILMALLMIVMVVAAGCGNDNANNKAPGASGSPAGTGSSASEIDPNESVELTLWATPNGLLNDGEKPGEWIAQDLIPEFNKKYPNVKINVELIPFDGIQEKVSVAAASKTLPNLLFDVANRILPLAQMGVVEPLDDILTPEDLQAVRGNPDLMRYASLNDQIVIMPLAAIPITMLVNKSMWAAKDALDLLPQNEFRTWSLDEFKTALKAVADPATGTYGFTSYALNEQGDELYNNTMMTHGVQLFNDDYTEYVAASNPKAEEVLAFYKSLVDEKLVTAHPETLSTTNANDYFFQGKTGIVVASPAVVQTIKSKLADGSLKEPFDYMFVNFPSDTEGQSGIKLSLGYGTVFKNEDAAQVKWSKIFFEWAINQTDMYFNALKQMKTVGAAPSWTQEDPEWQFLTKLMDKVGEWPLIDPLTKVKGFPEMRAAMYPEMQRLYIDDDFTPKQTIESISDKFNNVIKKYNQ